MENATKLLSLIFCENVQNIPNDTGMTTNIISAFDSIRVPFFPTLYSFFVVARIKFSELSPQNTVRVSIFDPDEELLSSTGNVNLPVPEIIPNDYSKTINFNMDIRNLLFKKEGDYNIVIYANDTEIGGNVIHISETAVR